MTAQSSCKILLCHSFVFSNNIGILWKNSCYFCPHILRYKRSVIAEYSSDTTDTVFCAFFFNHLYPENPQCLKLLCYFCAHKTTMLEVTVFFLCTQNTVPEVTAFCCCCCCFVCFVHTKHHAESYCVVFVHTKHNAWSYCVLFVQTNNNAQSCCVVSVHAKHSACSYCSIFVHTRHNAWCYCVLFMHTRQHVVCVCVCTCARVCVCVYVCVSEREREKLLKAKCRLWFPMKGKCGQDVLTTETCLIHQTQVACQIKAAVASLSEAGMALFSLSTQY